MSFLTSGFLLVAGILTLFGGGELFVAGAVAVSLLLGIPQVVIGLTVVSVGTSAPELFVSLLSILQGGDNLAVSNVVGSNIFNMLIVLGLSALVVPLRVKSRLVRRDVPLLLGVSMAVWGMASGSRITWQAGLALLVGLVMTFIWEIRTANENPEELGEDLEDDRSTTLVALFKLAVGLALLILGSRLLVKGAIGAALRLGVTQTVIGLTIVSAGTSMPELVTSLVAAFRGKADLAIGNVVGSSLLNLLLILGVCGAVSGGGGLAVDPVLVDRDFPVMLFATLACLPIFWTRGVISRLEGGILVGLYGLYLFEQLLNYGAPDTVDDYRLSILVVILPIVTIFLLWNVLRWRQKRRVSS